MAQVFISVGSNINRRVNIRGGIDALRKQYGTLTLSRVYESAAVGFDGDNFYNLVLAFESSDDVHSIVQRLREIEEQFGRVRHGPKFSSRTLDLDLLLYDQLILRDQGLDIPRDEIRKNAFVLLPLTEIAGELTHPDSGERYLRLWQDFDQQSQKLWPIDFAWDE